MPASQAADRRPLPKRIQKSIQRKGRDLGRRLEAFFRSQSLVENTAIIPGERFDWPAKLEANWTDIRDELDQLLQRREALPNMQDISDKQMGITENDGWKPFFLQAYGMRSERACELFPKTTALLDQIPDLEVAFFSILNPRAHISAHKGVYLGLVRAHLGLRIPQPVGLARMAVGDEMIRWEEGRCVVFDDTYRHEVWNDSDEVRAVLLIDVHRPFRPWAARVNRMILRLFRLTPFVRDAIRKHKAWEDSFFDAGRVAPKKAA